MSEQAAPAPIVPMEPMAENDAPPVPPAQVEPFGNDPNCDRVYNGRNCCADDVKCRAARSKVGNFKITSISLDITPHYNTTESQDQLEVAREKALANVESRVWKDRAGEVVAEGKFINYRNGLVHVLEADGDVVELKYRGLSEDDLCFVSSWWSLPTECSLAAVEYEHRNWIPSTMTWKASALCHKPLYFEEVGLERYGHSVGPIKQPFVSGAHFFGSLAALPYQMGIHPPNECQYALGYYRPGSCAPWLVPPLPISVRGAMAEAGAVLGGIYVIP